MKRWIPVSLILAVILSFVGCDAEQEAPVEPSAAEVTAEPTPVPTPEPTSAPTPVPAPEPPAQLIPAPVRFNDGEVTAKVTDHFWNSGVFFGAEDRLEVGSPEGEDISALYIVWIRQPQPFFLVYPDGSIQKVEDAMLHQAVRLEKPTPLVTVATSAPGKALGLGELFAYSAGTLPDEVQDWKRLSPGEADLCLFPAHADDEFIYFGGILPYYAGELGMKVQVCWMTSHDYDYRRNHERLNALWMSGCRYYPEINAAEDQLCYGAEAAARIYGFESFERFQVEMIRKYRPYVVVGHDEKGEYGHGAHCLAALTLEQAVTDAALPSLFPSSAAEYGAWDTPKCYLHLYGDDPTVLDDSRSLEVFGGMTIREAAAECFKQHVSQYSTGSYRVYSAGDANDARLFGLWRSLVGPDEEKTDLFEHIDRRSGK